METPNEKWQKLCRGRLFKNKPQTENSTERPARTNEAFRGRRQRLFRLRVELGVLHVARHEQHETRLDLYEGKHSSQKQDITNEGKIILYQNYIKRIFVKI